jgi:hypothetical protein
LEEKELLVHKAEQTQLVDDEELEAVGGDKVHEELGEVERGGVGRE